MITTILPTYKEPDFLDLAIKSLVNGQKYNNEIVVIVDGTIDINRHILEKWKSHINVITFEQNYGLSKATNIGVYNSKFDKILVMNSDNVAPMNWDEILLEDFHQNTVLTPNQIEPYDSMFKQFIKHDFGKNIKEFDYDVWKSSEKTFRSNKVDENGCTLPFLMDKYNYLKIGGWSEEYPTNTGQLVDWEFFLKCEMCEMKMKRTYKCNFYHFVSTSSSTPESIIKKQNTEVECIEFFKYKWGRYPSHNSTTNSKLFS